jgi:hypothetical protein
MQESQVNNQEETLPNPGQQFDSMYAVIDSQTDRPTGGDEVFRNFAIVTKELINNEAFKTAEGSSVAESFIGMLAVRGFTTPTHAWALVQRSYQERYIDRRQETGYPSAFEDIDVTRRRIRQLFNSHEDNEIFSNNFITKDVGSNIPQRAAGLKLTLLDLRRERLHHPPRVVDFGSSMNLILKKIQLGQQFDTVEVLGRYTKKDYDETDASRVTAANTNLINTLLEQGLELGRSVGGDLVSIVDEEVRRFIKSCSFYPGELTNEARIEEYEQLEAATNVPGVEFRQANFLKNGVLDEFKTDDEKPFDAAFISTMLYQHNLTEINRIIDVAKKHARFIIVQDFASRGTYDVPEHISYRKMRLRNVGTLQLHGDIAKPYGYQTLLLDSENEKIGWETKFKWLNGRCRRVMVPAPVIRDLHRTLRALQE